VKGIFAGALLLLLVQAHQATAPAEFTPGTVALLISQDEAHAKPAVEQALRHSDPSVRIMAARVAANAPVAGALPALVAALGGESNHAVAAEYVYDILLMAGAAAETSVEPHLRRNSPEAALAYAEWLARMRPEGLVSKLGDLFSLAPDAPYEFTRIVRMSGELHPDQRDALYTAWMKIAPMNAWRSLLFQSFAAPGALASGAPFLVSALKSDRGDIRTETVWFLVGRTALPDAVVDAALPASAEAPVNWESFGREVIARSQKHAQTPDRSDFLRSALTSGAYAPPDVRFNRSLTPSEHAVVTSAPPSAPTPVDPWFPAPAVTASSIAPGVVGSLLRASNCDENTDSFGAAGMTFGIDGRPKKITLGSEGLSAGCQAALTTLARLTIEDPDHAATEGVQMLVLPFNKDAVACVDAPAAQSRGALPVRVDRHRVQPPEKIRDAKTFFPPEAQKQSIQGAVIVETVIGPSGCVQHGRILRGLSPLLDAAALNTAMRMQFKPPMVDGKPAAVVMTMTINFGLTK
jgi:TonB family protein